MGNSQSAREVPKGDIDEINEESRCHLDEVMLQNWYDQFRDDCEVGTRTFSKAVFLQKYGGLFKFGDADRVFARIDRDGNGEVDFKEFMIGLCVTHCWDLGKRMEWAFLMYDSDKNGKLDYEEMKIFLTTVSNILAPPEHEVDIIKLADSIYAAAGKHAGRPSLNSKEFVRGIVSNRDTEMRRFKEAFMHEKNLLVRDPRINNKYR